MALLRTFTSVICVLGLQSFCPAQSTGGTGAPVGSKAFSIPREDAVSSLEKFSDVTDATLIYKVDQVRGFQTNRVEGKYTDKEALDLLLRESGLRMMQDEKTGTFAIFLEAPPKKSPRETQTMPPAAGGPKSETTPTPQMNSPQSTPRRLLGALAVLLAAPVLAPAQSAPAPSTAANVATETIKLNPFEVSEAKDNSFMSSTAGSASRLALDLKDTPIAYSVINREFIEALGIHDMQEAATWSTNTTSFADGNGADTFNHPIVVRGNQTSENYSSTGLTGAQRNFYSNTGVADSYAVESYDFARGPNAALFGAGNLSGTQSTQTKQARFDRPSTTVSVEYGSWSQRRLSVDYNLPLSERVGIRVNAVNQDSQGWRMMTRNVKKGLTVTGTFKLTPTTVIKLDANLDQALNHNPATLLFDNLSGWDGSTVFRGPITNAMFSTTATAGISNGLGQTLTFSGEPQGVDRLGANYYVYNVANGTVMNWQNSAITRWADSTSRVPLYTASAPNGVAFVRGTGPNFGYTNNGGGNEMNILHQPAGIPTDRFSRVVANSQFRIPSERFSPEPDTWYYNQRNKDVQIAITQRIGDRLFIDLGGDSNQTWNKNPGNALNFRFARLDLNQLRPDGSPNPGFLDVYADTNLNQNNSWTNIDTLRLNVGYALDLDKWGSYQFNVNGAMINRQSKTRNYSMSLMLNADQRLWAAGSDAIKIRTYWYTPSSRQFNEPNSVNFTQVDWTNPNAPVIQPAAARSTRWILSSWSERYVNTRNITMQTTARYFGGKLVATLGARRDSSANFTKSSLNTGDLPANWDGNTLLWRPDAPADYWTMTYIPKNQSTGVATSTKPVIVTGNRPRTTINGLSTRNPFFLNDRFRDDYNAPRVEAASNNYTSGLVWHAVKNVSLNANFSTTYDSPGGGGNNGSGTALDMLGNPVKAQRSLGYDFGPLFTFMDNKVSVKLNFYRTTQENNPYTPGTNSQINALINANKYDDSSIDGVNGRGVGPLPGNDYQQLRNDGTEIEIGANLTRGLRVTLNSGWGTHTSTEFGGLARTYVPANAELFKLLLEDAGGSLDTAQKPTNAPHAPGLAILTPIAGIPGGSPMIDQTSAVNAYNNIWIQYENVLGTADFRLKDQPNANFFADYTLQGGVAKGLRLGMGAQWQGSLRTGDRAQDTIIDPNNPLASIDDPRFNNRNLVYTKGYTIATGTAAYSFTTSSGYRMALNLRIKNLFNTRSVTFQGGVDLKTSLRQPEGDLTKPNRRAVPTQINRYSEPISFLLTSTVTFGGNARGSR